MVMLARRVPCSVRGRQATHAEFGNSGGCLSRAAAQLYIYIYNPMQRLKFGVVYCYSHLAAMVQRSWSRGVMVCRQRSCDAEEPTWTMGDGRRAWRAVGRQRGERRSSARRLLLPETRGVEEGASPLCAAVLRLHHATPLPERLRRALATLSRLDRSQDGRGVGVLCNPGQVPVGLTDCTSRPLLRHAACRFAHAAAQAAAAAAAAARLTQRV